MTKPTIRAFRATPLNGYGWYDWRWMVRLPLANGVIQTQVARNFREALSVVDDAYRARCVELNGNDHAAG